MANIGYFIDSIGGQQWFRCLQCKYDVFSVDSIRTHVKMLHNLHSLPEESIPIEQWIKARMLEPKLHIGITLLTWNTKDASSYAAHAVFGEKIRLQEIGYKVSLFWADNGSTDGTVSALEREFGETLAAKFLFSENKGQSEARNALITAARMANVDQLLMVDGDIELVPWSACAMSRYLVNAPKEIGCIGVYCRNCTHVMDSEVATECRTIHPWMAEADPPIAWTNYGMFRREVLDYCWFEDSGPFAGPGWGFEDDDYYMQMATLGYRAVNTKYFRHLHRRRHSSVRILGDDLAAKVHLQRKAFLMDKWKDSDIPEIRRHVTQLANQHMPVMEY